MKYKDVTPGLEIRIVHRGEPAIATVQRIAPHQASAKGWRMTTLAVVKRGDFVLVGGDPDIVYMPVHETELHPDQS